jgi:hypothetical protein
LKLFDWPIFLFKAYSQKALILKYIIYGLGKIVFFIYGKVPTTTEKRGPHISVVVLPHPMRNISSIMG